MSVDICRHTWMSLGEGLSDEEIPKQALQCKLKGC
jgi:hypothetical protein